MEVLIYNEVLVLGMVNSIDSYFSEGATIASQVLALLMVMDVITGVLSASKRRTLRSLIMSLGIKKKAGVMMAILLALLLDVLIGTGVPALSTGMILFSIGNESLSIVENLHEIGVPIPDVIMSRIMSLSDQSLYDDEDIYKEYVNIQKKFEDDIEKCSNKGRK